MDQLKQRNTLKDGIIMIQTLLIILFIIVPIFLLLDKVPAGAGDPWERWEVGTGQIRHGQGLHLLRLCSCSLEQAPPQILSIGSLFIHSFVLGDSFFPPPTQTHIPGPLGMEDPNTLNCVLLPPRPHRTTARLGWRKITPTR